MYLLVVLGAVFFLRTLSGVPRAQISSKVPSDAPHPQNMFALTDWAFTVDDTFVVALLACVYWVVNRAIANVLLLH